MKDTGVDQEPHGQTTSRSGWEILEGMVAGERDGKTKSHMDRQHQGMGNIGGNGGG